MTDAPTGLIAGRYRLGELLGTGGTASVFSAADVATGAEVALKILHPHLANSTEARQAMFDEARSAMALQHPNVAVAFDVGVHDVGDGMVAWIAMQRASGVTLSDLVHTGGRLPLADALTVADAVLSALDAAHAIGLIHRDVSPANIMVDRNADGSLPADGVRLLDFGLADAAGRTTVRVDSLAPERGGILGNAEYASPEQARGEPVDERGDLYQLGGVLHFALTGQSPFPRATVQATLVAHLTAPPPVPSVTRRDVPRHVDRLVVKALLKDADGRFQRAAEMRAAVIEARGLLPDWFAKTPNGADRTEVLATGVATDADSAAAARTVVFAAAPSRAAQSIRGTGARAPRRPRRRRTGRSAGTAVAGLMVTVLIGSAWLLASASSSTTAATPIASAPPHSDPPSSSSPTPASSAPPASAVARVPAIELSGLTDARAALTAVGLIVGNLTVQNSVHPGDTVLAVSPAQGSPLPVGGAVDVVVASGSNSVPDVRGMSQADATASLAAAGFDSVARSVIANANDQTPAGSVLGTEPAAQATVRLGSAVTLVLAAAAPSPTPTLTPTPDPGPTPAPTPEPEVHTASPTRANLLSPRIRGRRSMGA